MIDRYHRWVGQINGQIRGMGGWMNGERDRAIDERDVDRGDTWKDRLDARLDIKVDT